MRRFFSVLLMLCLLLTATSTTAIAANGSPSPTPPSIPLEGDIWDGEATTEPTKLVQQDGIYYYQINTCAELAYIAQAGGDWLTYNYILQNNLLLNDTQITWDDNGNCTNTDTLNEWTPITRFKGVFDGNGFTVSGMYINQPEQSNIGLFSVVGSSYYDAPVSATIKNLNVVNSFVVGSSYVGGIVGKYDIYWNDSESVFSNCTFSGFVRAYGTNAGGLAGFSSGGYRFSHLTNYGDVRAGASAGGIISSAYRLKYCYNYGDVSYLGGSNTSGDKFGGIAGIGSTYTYCTNFGTVNGVTNVGGIYGCADSGTYDPQYCENRGKVCGETYVGGIAGQSGNEGVEQCKNSGIVIGKDYVGGIIGKRNSGVYYNSYTVKDVYNIGSVSGENYIGGIVGYAADKTNMSSAYNIGSVSATGIAGAILCSDGLVWGKSSADDCFYEKAKTPSLFGCGFSGATGDVGGIAAKTASELKQLETYPEYDYSNNPSGWNTTGNNATWKFGTYNDGYPYLSWESVVDATELTGISLTTDAVSIGVGDTHWLHVQPLPVYSALSAVNWQSSDESVATIDSNGKMTGVGVGTATITVSCENVSAFCTVSVSARASEEYKIGKLIVRDSNGAEATTIPDGTFLVSIPITKLTDVGNTMVLLASYDNNGKYVGMLYVSIDNAPVGTTVTISFPVNNSKEDIAQLKAFTIASFSNLQPLGASSCFPAQE